MTREAYPAFVRIPARARDPIDPKEMIGSQRSCLETANLATGAHFQILCYRGVDGPAAMFESQSGIARVMIALILRSCSQFRQTSSHPDPDA